MASGTAESPDDDSDALFPSNTCHWCAHVLLPPDIQTELKQRDAIAVSNDDANACAKYLDRLLDEEQGVSVRRTLGDLVDGANRGCIICGLVVNAVTNGWRTSSSDEDEEKPKRNRQGAEQEWTTHIKVMRQLGAHSLEYPRGSTHGRYDLSWLQLYFCRGWKSRFRGWKIRPYGPPGAYTFRIFTHDASAAARTVSSRGELDPLPATLRARAIAEECRLSHKDCRGHKAEADILPEELPHLPTRVIDVDGGNDAQVRIFVTNGQRGHYTALSYCWGSSDSKPHARTMLWRANLSELQNGISISLLPQTIADAVLTTRNLSLKYLWVDALCIVQDDEAEKDREIAVMHLIYSNAYVTIAAASPSSCFEGFMHRKKVHDLREDRRHHGQIFYPRIKGQESEVTCVNIQPAITPANFDGDNEPLFHRAWPMQEMLLSKRLLMFTSVQIYWWCASRTLALGDSPYTKVQPKINDLPTLHYLHNLGPLDSATKQQAHRDWLGIVSAFSHCRLSYELDRLPALAGIAARFQASLGESYLAGLWQGDIPLALAWARLTPIAPLSSRRRASWSWAFAGEGGGYRDLSPFCRKASTVLLDHRIKLVHEQSPLSRVEHGVLRLRGDVQSILWDGAHFVKLDPEDRYCAVEAFPDWSYITMADTEGQIGRFHMTNETAGRNGRRRVRVALLPVTDRHALMLCRLRFGDERYTRIGLVKALSMSLPFPYRYEYGSEGEEIIEVE